MNKKFQRDGVNLSLLVILLSLFIEYSSFLDFVSDIIIIFSLANTEHTAWLAFSLFTVLAPYYTVYTSLINYQIVNLKRQHPGDRSMINTVFNCFLILPTMLIFLIVFDIIYMCISVIVYPILLPFAFSDIGSRMLDQYEDSQNIVLYKLFGLS